MPSPNAQKAIKRLGFSLSGQLSSIEFHPILYIFWDTFLQRFYLKGWSNWKSIIVTSLILNE